MRFDNYQFPHPVLTNFTDDVNGDPSFEEEINESKDCYSVEIAYNTNNQLLDDYLNNNMAEIICEFNCSGTVYRDSVTANNNTVSFEIRKEDVRGKVSFSNYLVAKKDIIGYSNPNAHSDYNGFTFNIETGDVLVYFGDFSFNAAINYKKLKAVSSFLKIEERSKIQLAEFDIDDDRIIVKLPEKDYSIYKKQPIAKNEDFAPVFHSSIVFSALIYALQNIDRYEGKMWADVIYTRLKEDEFKGLSLDNESGDIIKIAQILLGNPINRLLNGLDKISESYI